MMQRRSDNNLGSKQQLQQLQQQQQQQMASGSVSSLEQQQQHQLMLVSPKQNKNTNNNRMLIGTKGSAKRESGKNSNPPLKQLLQQPQQYQACAGEEGRRYQPVAISSHQASKAKSNSSGRTKVQPHQPGTQLIQPSAMPQLQATQSMSSLQQMQMRHSQPFNFNNGAGVVNQNGTGRVVISPQNFINMRAATMSGDNQQSASANRPGSGLHHGGSSLGRISSRLTTNHENGQSVEVLQNQATSQQQQSSDNQLKQLRKSQISALRQIQKPRQPSNEIGDILHQPLSKHETAMQPSESEYGSIGRPNEILNQDQIKIKFYKNAENGSSQQQLQQTTKSRKNNKHNNHNVQQQQQLVEKILSSSGRGSEDNSDDYQAVAEEDMGSFIFHRQAYLDGDIQTATESQLFKQQPKLGRDPRPNPNAHSGKSQSTNKVAATNATGSSALRQYSSQKQLITGSIVSQLSHHSMGGTFSSQNNNAVPINTNNNINRDTNVKSFNAVEDMNPVQVQMAQTIQPKNLQTVSDVKKRRKQSANSNSNNTISIKGGKSASSTKKLKSGRKSQNNYYSGTPTVGMSNNINNAGSKQPQMMTSNSLAGSTGQLPNASAAARIYSKNPLQQPLSTRNMTTMAMNNNHNSNNPASFSQQALVYNSPTQTYQQYDQQQQMQQMQVMPNEQQQKLRASTSQKGGLQRVETQMSTGDGQVGSGVSKPQYPMFSLVEDNKKAMIQFEMNLLARQNNKQGVAACYSLRQQQQDSQQHGTTTLLNKATLCDSANSKQNSSNSAFLRKSLWLLTSLKNKALKDVVNAQQGACQACHYLRKQGVGCFAQPQNILSPMKQQPLQQHGQTFVFSQNTSTNVAVIPIVEKQASAASGSAANSQQTTAAPTNTIFMGSSMKSSGILSGTMKEGPNGRPNQAKYQQKRLQQSQQRTNFNKTNSLTGGGISLSQGGVNWLGSIMGTQALLVETHEHEFWKRVTQRTLNTKYLTSQEYYNSKIAADIMYNEQRHIVSVFKEYLIFDDFSEYLKRFYTYKEAQDRLPRVFEFYDHYSKVFPNYVSVPESKYMFKNIERKQKLIDQRHQIFLKQQQNKEGKDDKDDKNGVAGGFKHSANMLLGSQFLKEVYADDDKSMSIASLTAILDNKNELAASKSLNMQKFFESTTYNMQNRLKGLDVAANSDFISPQARQVLNAKQINKDGQQQLSVDISTVRHQNELENVISMLGKFEKSKHAEESMSVTISRSYIDGATGLGDQPKSTPQRLANYKDDSKKKQPRIVGSNGAVIKKSDKNADSSIKKNTNNNNGAPTAALCEDQFIDGWNLHEPKHDLSMSSWALTSFIKNIDCADQPSELMIDPTEEISIDEFVPQLSVQKRDSKKIIDSAANNGGGRFSISAMPHQTSSNMKKIKKVNNQEALAVTQKFDYNPKPKTNAKITANLESGLQSGNKQQQQQQQQQQQYVRNSAVSPKHGAGAPVSQQDMMKQIFSLQQKSSSILDKNAIGHQQLKSGRLNQHQDRGSVRLIKQTPQREDNKILSGTKKKSSIVGKTTSAAMMTTQAHTNKNLANSRCPSKLSIGSANQTQQQTSHQQTMTKKNGVGQQGNNTKKQIERMIKDTSLKLQLEKNAANRHYITTVASKNQRSGAATTTNSQAPKVQLGIGQSLAALATNSNEILHSTAGGPAYNTSMVQSTNLKSSKSNQNQNNNNNGVAAVNTSRNTKVSHTSRTGLKSSSQLGNAAGTNAASSEISSSVYKNSGQMMPQSAGQGVNKVFKVHGYDDSKGLNDRFIDLNKASEGAPKIQKPGHVSQPLSGGGLKQSEFSQHKSSTQSIRTGDHSAKTKGNGVSTLLAGFSSTQAPSNNSVRTGQHGLAIRKSLDTHQQQTQHVLNQYPSPVSNTNTSLQAQKLQGQAKNSLQQRGTNNSRPIKQPSAEAMMTQDSQIAATGVISAVQQALANVKSGAQSKAHQLHMQQTNLPQIFKKEQRNADGKAKLQQQQQHQQQQYEQLMQKKTTIFQHDTGPSINNNYTSLPASQSQQQIVIPLYNSKKSKQLQQLQQQQSPDSGKIHFNQQHTASKSHEPKERQSKLDSTSQKHMKDNTINVNQQQSMIANSVIGHHMNMLNNTQQQMMNQATSSNGPSQMSSQNARSIVKHQGSSKQQQLDGNMLIQNNILAKSSASLLHHHQKQISSNNKTAGASANPYSKTGRILNSLNSGGGQVNKQQSSMQSMGSTVGRSGGHHDNMSSTSAGGGYLKKQGGRSQKINTKTSNSSNNNHHHSMKGPTGSSVSSSSSIGSAKISLNSAQLKSENSQIYLTTLNRANQMMSQKSSLAARKTPSGSNSSSKTKKIKVATSTATLSSIGKSKVKSTSNIGAMSSATKHSSNAAQNPYPVGASQGHTIFSVSSSMPRQTSYAQQQTHGIHQVNSKRLNKQL